MGADPTALGDRALAEGNPHLILEGALLAAFATGASELILAVRRDWTQAIGRLRAAIEEAEASRLAGYLILGTDFSCQASVWEGSGALVAGEETALLAALAGDRGMPVIRPPYPTEKGLARCTDHRPERGDARARRLDPGPLGRGLHQRRHARPRRAPSWSASTAASASLAWSRSRWERHWARSSTWRADRWATVKAVFVGGAGGGALSADELRTPYDVEPLRAAGAGIGLGQVLVTDTATCMVDTARFFLDWSAREACGKAVPCRIGTKRLVETLDRILAATPRPDDLDLLRALSRKMTDTALCKLEARAPGPMLTTLDRFPDEYRAHAERGECLAGVHAERGPVPLLSAAGRHRTGGIGMTLALQDR